MNRLQRHASRARLAAADFALTSLLVFVLAACRKEPGEEHSASARRGDEESHAAPFTVEHTAAGEAVVVLAPEALAASGLAMAAPIARDVVDELAAFGTLVADPARIGVLRAPLPGTLAAAAGADGTQGAASWPAVGARVAAGTPIGTLLPRTAPLTTAELADLQARLASARSDELGTEAELSAAKSALDRATRLNALDKGVSDQVVENAAAQVKSVEARRAAAQAIVAIFEQAAGSAGTLALTPLPPMPLSSPRGGEVIAVLAQPGESVEAGAELLRVAEFGELFADVRLPAGGAGGAPSRARVVPNGGAEGAGFDATIVGPAPQGDALAPTLRLRVRDPKGTLRPGLGVTAWLARDGASRPGFAIAASAALRYAGRSWVYVETEAGHFTRRAITILRADGDALLVTSGVDATTRIVTVGAMVLLSQEQLAAGGGEEE